jgi:hypothetical protein
MAVEGCVSIVGEAAGRRHGCRKKHEVKEGRRTATTSCHVNVTLSPYAFIVVDVKCVDLCRLVLRKSFKQLRLGTPDFEQLFPDYIYNIYIYIYMCVCVCVCVSHFAK